MKKNIISISLLLLIMLTSSTLAMAAGYYSPDTNLKRQVNVSARQLDGFIKYRFPTTFFFDNPIFYQHSETTHTFTSSPLEGLGKSWVAAGRKYHVNPVYLMAHAIVESAWGTSEIAGDKKNIYGYNAYGNDPYNTAAKFANFSRGIDLVANQINRGYLLPPVGLGQGHKPCLKDEAGNYLPGAHYHEELGPSLRGMNRCYAADGDWAKSILKVMNEFADSLKLSPKGAPNSLHGSRDFPEWWKRLEW